MNEVECINIQDLLPQRPPFVMVDRMISFTPEKVVTQLTVREDNIFVDNGHFTVSGLNENIAQTCASRMGYLSRASEGNVKLGFIGAIDTFTAYRTPKVGETIETTMEVIEEVFNIVLARAVVRLGDEVLAEARLKIALSDIIKK
jgi:3-hydroxymyristoyl/3-hydroxydecanoyl-(acyl carrier protein) dehydratase